MIKLPLFCYVLLPLALLAQNPVQVLKPRLAGPTGVPTPPPSNVAPDAVVLVVGDMKFTRAQFESLIQKGAVDKMSQTDRRRMAVGLANFITLAAEARRQALDQTPYAQLNLMLVQDQWLANALVGKEVRDKPIDDAVLKTYYEKNQAKYDQVTCRHILIRTHSARGIPIRPGHKDLTDDEALAKALEVKKKLDAGADFAELAKVESDEPNADKTGGELHPFVRGAMVKEFEEAAFAAPVGKVTDPVKTVFGYHLILVTDHKLKPFDEAKVDIEHKLRPEMESQYVNAVRMGTAVTIDEGYFGKPEAPPPTLGR